MLPVEFIDAVWLIGIAEPLHNAAGIFGAGVVERDNVQRRH
jgi:hypothetical protein